MHTLLRFSFNIKWIYFTKWEANRGAKKTIKKIRNHKNSAIFAFHNNYTMNRSIVTR